MTARVSPEFHSQKKSTNRIFDPMTPLTYHALRCVRCLPSHSPKQIAKRLREVGGNTGLPYLKFVVNPTSFSQTTENLFYFSFLVREQKAAVEVDEDPDSPFCGDMICCEFPVPLLLSWSLKLSLETVILRLTGRCAGFGSRGRRRSARRSQRHCRSAAQEPSRARTDGADLARRDRLVWPRRGRVDHPDEGGVCTPRRDGKVQVVVKSVDGFLRFCPRGWVFFVFVLFAFPESRCLLMYCLYTCKNCFSASTRGVCDYCSVGQQQKFQVPSLLLLVTTRRGSSDVRLLLCDKPVPFSKLGDRPCAAVRIYRPLRPHRRRSPLLPTTRTRSPVGRSLVVARPCTLARRVHTTSTAAQSQNVSPALGRA